LSLLEMGCNSGKAPASSLIAKSGAPDNTLLSGGTQNRKDATKELSEDKADRASSSMSRFDGEWCYEKIRGEWTMGTWTNATISGATLTWAADGRTSKVLVDRGAGVIKLRIRGQECTGELQSDGKIHWSNDDVWVRSMGWSPSRKSEYMKSSRGNSQPSLEKEPLLQTGPSDLPLEVLPTEAELIWEEQAKALTDLQALVGAFEKGEYANVKPKDECKAQAKGKAQDEYRSKSSAHVPQTLRAPPPPRSGPRSAACVSSNDNLPGRRGGSRKANTCCC
jgi:hypothetical protein